MVNVNYMVLVRHGESQWNYENRFTGWEDIDLSQQGYAEAKQAGKLISEHGFVFDYGYTSLLKRAIHTLWCILDEINQPWLSIKKSWRLNERHYGALQGCNKEEIAKQYGDLQVKQWRRSFNTIPPKINDIQQQHIKNDIRYSQLTPKNIPNGESLSMTIDRVLPLWHHKIFPKVKNKEQILIVAHGNSLRALIKYLSKLSDTEILDLNIPTGTPLVYEFNTNFEVINHYYLTNK